MKSRLPRETAGIDSSTQTPGEVLIETGWIDSCGRAQRTRAGFEPQAPGLHGMGPLSQRDVRLAKRPNVVTGQDIFSVQIFIILTNTYRSMYDIHIRYTEHLSVVCLHDKVLV